MAFNIDPNIALQAGKVNFDPAAIIMQAQQGAAALDRHRFEMQRLREQYDAEKEARKQQKAMQMGIATDMASIQAGTPAQYAPMTYQQTPQTGQMPMGMTGVLRSEQGQQMPQPKLFGEDLFNGNYQIGGGEVTQAAVAGHTPTYAEMLDIGLKQSMLAKDQDSFFKYAKAIQDAKKDPTKYFGGLTEAIDPVTQKPILLAMTEAGAVPSGYAPKAKEPKTSLVKTSNGFEVVRDGELPKGTPPVDMPAPEKPITGYQKIKLEGELRDDYRNDSKTYLEIARQAKIIQNSLNDKSAAGTLASATAFMKMLDPGSVVRESELAMAMKTNGALDRMGNYINVILSGKVLTEQQKVDFAKLVKSYSEAANEAHAKTNERYWKIASEYKLDPKRVVLYDIEKEKPATVKANINHGDTINELPTSAPKGSVAKNPTTGQPEYIFNGIKWIPYGSNK